MTEVQSEQRDQAPEVSPIPPGVKMPSDRQKSAAQLEAEGTPTLDVEWRDFSFTIDSDADDWEVETTLAFEEGKIATGVRGVLGPQQWKSLLASKPKNRDLSDLFNLIAEKLGLDTSGN